MRYRRASPGGGVPASQLKGGQMSRARLAAMLALTAVAALGAVPAANAGPTSSTTAIVALGDSFSSGEAGRWQGNSLNIFGTRDGTDRAARCTLGIFCSYDAHRVYGSSYDNGCHRADVAPIKSAAISVSEKINLACSGAQTQHIWRASQGGQTFKGEAPQADQLLPIAQQKNVKLVAAEHHRERPRLHQPRDRLHGRVDARLHLQRAGTGGDRGRHCRPRANGLRKAIDEIRAVMSAPATASQYKLVIQGYASPIPVGADIRYRSRAGTVSRWAAARSTTRTPTGRRTRPRRRSWTTCARWPPRRAHGSSTCATRSTARGLPPGSSLVTGSRPEPVTQGVGALDELRLLPGRRAGVAAPERLRRAGDRQVHRADLRAGERQLHLPQHAGRRTSTRCSCSRSHELRTRGASPRVLRCADPPGHGQGGPSEGSTGRCPRAVQAFLSGSLTTKVVPAPAPGSTHMWPPLVSTKPFAMARPGPARGAC